MENKYCKILYDLALKAYKKYEIPVSALIVCNDKIVAKAFNKKNINNNSLLHAEIICLQKAYKKLKRWNLNDCVMYISLEPCDMCKLLIEESRINKVFYILNKGSKTNKYKKTQYEQMYASNLEQFEKLMQKMFKKMRK